MSSDRLNYCIISNHKYIFIIKTNNHDKHYIQSEVLRRQLHVQNYAPPIEATVEPQSYEPLGKRGCS